MNFASFIIPNATNINVDELVFTLNFVLGVTNFQVDTAQVEATTASSLNVLDAGISVHVNYFGNATATALFSALIIDVS